MQYGASDQLNTRPFRQRELATRLIGRPLAWAERFGKLQPGEAIGIEVEVHVPTAADMSCPPLSCNVTSDASLSPPEGYRGVEFRIVCGVHWWQPLYRLCDWLAKQGAIVNKSCGLHVHLDCRDCQLAQAAPDLIAVKARAMRLFRCVRNLEGILPPSRRHGGLPSERYFAYIAPAFGGNRYKVVNLTAFHRHKTVEVRVFGGSVDPDKIQTWASVLWAASRETRRYAFRACTTPLDVASWIMTFPAWGLREKAWLLARLSRFQPEVREQLAALTRTTNDPEGN